MPSTSLQNRLFHLHKQGWDDAFILLPRWQSLAGLAQRRTGPSFFVNPDFWFLPVFLHSSLFGLTQNKAHLFHQGHANKTLSSSMPKEKLNFLRIFGRASQCEMKIFWKKMQIYKHAQDPRNSWNSDRKKQNPPKNPRQWIYSRAGMGPAFKMNLH